MAPVEANGSGSSIQFGAFTLIADEQRLLRDGQPVLLTPKAFDLLAILAANPGRLLTKEQLMQAVWPDTIVEDSNLTYNIFALRKALDDTAENSRYIETVPKRGYRFAATAITGVTSPSPGLKTRPTDSLNGRWSVAAIGLAVGAVVGAVAGAGIVLLTTRMTVPAPRIAYIPPGVQLSEASPLALSPDGEQLAFVGRGADGVTRLWVRKMKEFTARPIPRTETLLSGFSPPIFWSPDSQQVAFYAVGNLKSVNVRDGATRTLCALPGLAVGGSWNADGSIVVGQPNAGLIRCSVTDDRFSWLTRLDPDKGETAHLLPWFLPDGRHFVYVRVARNAPEGSGVYLGSLDDTPGAAAPRRLLPTGFGAAYVPTKGSSIGHIIFLRDATMFAQAFDERALRVRGDPTELATPVGSYLDGGFFSASQNDVIAFRPPDKDFQLTWHDTAGNRVGTLGEVGRYRSVAISPDGARVATAKEAIGSIIDQDILILETKNPTTTKATFGPGLEDMPVWSSREGRRLIFTIGGETGNLFEQIVDGSTKPRALLETQQHKVPTSVSRDGRFLLYTVANNDHLRLDVWVLPLTGGAKPFPFIQRDRDQDQAQFHPDGQWVAYTSNESGRNQVRVKRFREPSDGRPLDPEIPVSTATGGGTAPRWHPNGQELYYFAEDGSLMAATVTMGATLSFDEPKMLFRIPGSRGDWDVASDGRFLIAIPTGADASAPFAVMWNPLAQLESVH